MRVDNLCLDRLLMKIVGKTCQWRTFVGYQWRHGQDRRHEDLRLVRICQRQGTRPFDTVSYDMLTPFSPADPNIQNGHRGESRPVYTLCLWF